MLQYFALCWTEHMVLHLKAYEKLSMYPEPTLPVKYPRTPGYRPSQQENKHNAWYIYKCIQISLGDGWCLRKWLADSPEFQTKGENSTEDQQLKGTQY